MLSHWEPPQLPKHVNKIYKCVGSLSELSAARMHARVCYGITVIVAEGKHHVLLRHAVQECECIIQSV